MAKELSIIIVSYNCIDHLLLCLQSINNQSVDFEYEVIVVDNASADNSRSVTKEKFPHVKWIESGYNAGFARANNIGIKSSVGRLILILNPDTEMPDGFLKKFVALYNEKDNSDKLGIAGCKIISSKDNSLLIGSGNGFPSLRNTLYANPLIIRLARILGVSLDRRYDAYEMHGQDHEVDFVSGACAMITKSKIEHHNLYFDEDFFLYYEDVEWCLRTQKKGLSNFFFSGITIYHVNSAVTNKYGLKERQILVSSFLFYFKTMGLIVYYFHGALLAFNYLLTIFLLRRANQLDLCTFYKGDFKIFRSIYFRISSLYKKKPSSAKSYLKYVE